MPIDLLTQKNDEYCCQFKKSPLMQLVNSKKMENEHYRMRLLDALQVFSDHFQKIVMLRYSFCDDKSHLSVATQHLKEEFGHNLSLEKDRKHRTVPWDPILEATAGWFTWKMFTLDNDEKIILVHFVLETSANIFFQAANKVMEKYQETDYFKIHSEADEKHEKMGLDLLKAFHPEKLERLFLIQKQGWEMLQVICNEIAVITNGKSLSVPLK